MSELSRADIVRLLEALERKLAEQSVTGELYLVGGAVMCLVFQERPSTKDVDGYFAPKETVRAAARAVGVELGFGENWLNDAVKGFLSERGTYTPFFDLPHLKVFTADPAYLLAMKCLSLRLGPLFRDEEDVRFLLRYLNIETLEEALAILGKYYPLERYPPKTRYILTDLLGSTS
ncbi:MAG TPA: hypothetical protein VGM03_21185 [Phycisphaerae bacterium]|jgi:hypothetical protein